MVAVSEKDSISHVDTALMNTICLVMCECLTDIEDMLVSPCLVRRVFLCVSRSETGRFLSVLWKVCLMVCGVAQNQRSLQSGEEAWLLMWQYQHLAARVN